MASIKLNVDELHYTVAQYCEGNIILYLLTSRTALWRVESDSGCKFLEKLCSPFFWNLTEPGQAFSDFEVGALELGKLLSFIQEI